MSNQPDENSPTGPVNLPSDESGSSNGGSSNSRQRTTRKHLSRLTTVLYHSLCTNSKTRNHTTSSHHVSSTEDRQATTARLHDVHPLVCATRTPEAPRAISHQGETLRMSPMHQVLCAARSAVTPSTEATSTGRDHLTTSQCTTREHLRSATH